MKTKVATPRTLARALHWLDKGHRPLGVCPGCNLDVVFHDVVDTRRQGRG